MRRRRWKTGPPSVEPELPSPLFIPTFYPQMRVTNPGFFTGCRDPCRRRGDGRWDVPPIRDHRRSPWQPGGLSCRELTISDTPPGDRPALSVTALSVADAARLLTRIASQPISMVLHEADPWRREVCEPETTNSSDSGYKPSQFAIFCAKVDGRSCRPFS